jgi:Spy/CpxP family protein refolding chaperone
MVIFGCGVITGALLMKTELPAAIAAQEAPMRQVNSTNPPPPWSQVQRPEFLRRMQKQLDLSPAQRDEIAKIMKDSQDRSRPLWEEIAPQMRAEVKRVRQEIRAVLTPGQQTKFDELLKSRQRKAEAARATTVQPASSPAETNAP